ncbi:AsmA family protein [Corallococcus aberystwythensis]|uniref:AsmA family protein n=1 Tax=Corallococcus aberystwythensis TaxID=2316722 RepID=A0A3A8QGM1_9BACT|nr:AsmA family protein [Corallococcus aberystwythensis]RKH64042.1 AsmA family protein [Corallococcus aberystwythensis]
MDSPGAGRPRRRLKRIIAGAFLITLATFVLLLVAVVTALHHLDHPWLKPRILSEVEAATSIRLDYRTARIDVLSGLRLEDLVVRTPPPFQAIAPELLRVGTLEASWSPGALLNGPVRVERVVVRDATVVLVADDQGTTSLTNLSGPPEPEPLDEASPGISRQVADLFAAPFPVASITLSGVSLTYLRVQGSAVVDRWSLRGLEAGIEAKPQDKGWKLLVDLGQTGKPLALTLNREGPAVPAAEALLELALSVEANAEAARVKVDLDVARQTFDPRFTLRSLLHGAVTAKFNVTKQHTTVELDRTQLTDSAEVQAQLVLPDAAEVPPVLTRALADVDLGRLSRWIPADLLPFTLKSGKVHLEAQEVTLSDMPQLGAKGRVGLDVDVAQLLFVQDALRVALGDGRVSLTATPDVPQGLAARLTFALQGLDVGGPTPLRVPKASGELTGRQLRPDLGSPFRVAGDAALSAKLDALDVRASGLRATAERLGLNLQVPLTAKAPFALKADLPVESLRVVSAEGRELLKGPARVQLHVTDAFPTMEEPPLSKARARLELDVGTLHALLDATKGTDDVAYALDVQTPDLVAARPFIPDDVATRFPWKHLAVTLASKGRLTALFAPSPRVDHQTELRLQRPGWDDVSAASAALVLKSKGDAWKHQGALDLKVEGLRIGETDAGTQHQTLTFDVDRRKLALQLGLNGQAGLKVAADAALAFNPKARALRMDVKGDFPPLGPLSPLLAKARVPPEVDLSKLAMNGELHGTLTGLITHLGPDGTFRLAAMPPRAASFEGKAQVNLIGVRWKHPEQSINVPTLRWQGESHANGSQRTVRTTLAAEKLTVSMNERRLTFADLSSDSTATFTDQWEKGDIELKQLVKVRSLEMKPALPYPVQDVEASFSVLRKPTGVIRIPDLRLSNGGTRTQLKVQGRLDLSNDQQRMGLRGSLEQDLAHLARPGQLEGSGKATVDFLVASPDLTVFRTFSSLKLQDVNVRLPEAGIVVEALNGDVPLTENVEVSQDGVRLLNDLEVNPYSMLRFADQHPLLTRSGFMSAERITTPWVTIAPLAGNLSINQNVFSMSQLEMGVRGGRITGQCMLDYQGKRSTLEAHVRATGVKSSRGEPFDGNAAMVISARDRSINGRAEILRIGNRHLLDLLDVEDPRHADPATNRVRYALSLGYPEHVRVSFKQGFGSLLITMGGLARLVSIDEIRGIPLGPIVDRLITTMFPPEALP